MAYNRCKQEEEREELAVFSIREMAPSGGWRNGWRMQMLQNPSLYEHLQVFFAAIPLIWVQDDQGVPGGTPGSRMGLRYP